MPELYDHVGEGAERHVRVAIMDVVAHFHGTLSQKWLDVTVRSAHTERYERAKATPGLAARTAEAEKHARYGDQVVPVVFEALGRLGSEGADALRTLVSAAAAAAACSPHAVGRLRAELERAVLYSVADNHLRSLGLACSPCTTHAQRPPAQGRQLGD